MEDIARDYFNSLPWRTFCQEPEKDDDGNVVSCKMNDLMHDLAVFVSGDVCSMHIKQGDMTNIPDGCRHLSLVCSSYHEGLIIDSTASNRAEKLRTLWALTSGNATVSHSFSIHLPCLRVLDLSCLDVVTKDTLNSISLLKRLRYLHLSCIQILPESFSKLRHLQRLRLTSCCWDLGLPTDTESMISLRHLKITSPSRLTHMPAKIGELNLQTLSVFVVGKESGCNIRELGCHKLGGELNIWKLENVGTGRNARGAKLDEKPRLRSLTFSWNPDIDADMRKSSSEQTLEALRPHPNPKCLTDAISSPPLGQLPSLKFLRIGGMNAVKRIGSRFYRNGAFPSLLVLFLQDMPKLEEWSEPSHPHSFARLERAAVVRCPKLTGIPLLTPSPSLQSLVIIDFEAAAAL
ncbi:hypothetical protein ACLOJK_024737 [Asimina triloba]